jgi:CHAD domain-containing protein
MTVELLAPEGATLESATAGIARALAVRERPARARDRAYYDTFDGLLRAAGLTLSHEAGRLALAGSNGGPRSAQQAIRRPSRPLHLSDLPEGPLRDALRAVVGVRALLPLAQIRSHERALDVLDDEEKTVARLVVAAPSLAGSNQALAPRAVLAPVRGYDAELAAARDTLSRELGFAVSDRTVLDEAVLAGGGVPGGVSSAVRVTIVRGQAAETAAAAVLRRLLEIVRANLEGTLADIDPEFLHDLRVAVRRSRAVQRELRGVFSPIELARFRAEFRWLQEVTGPTRDLDIHVIEFDDYRCMVAPQFRADLDPLLAVLRARRRRALLAMRRALRSARAEEVLDKWEQYLGRLPAMALDGRPDAKRAVDELVGERIARVYRRMVRDGTAITEASPPETLHELRKKGKELRYLFELFGLPLYGEAAIRPIIKTLKGLQDVLGRHQDRAVQVAQLSALLDEVAGRAHSARALVATGALAQQLLDDELAARAEFADRFAVFASPAMRRQVKEALR